MKVIFTILLFAAALHLAQSLFFGSLLMALPFGPIVATSGIIGFKVAMGAAILSFISKGITGNFGVDFRAGTGIAAPNLRDKYVPLTARSGLLEPPTTVTTTDEPVEPTVRMPVSALQTILSPETTPHHQTDVLFLLLKEVDDNGCVSRLVCESAADALRFGKLGNATMHFFDGNTGVKTGPGSVFLAAAQAGRTQGVQGCATLFPKCTADLPHILSLAGLMEEEAEHRELQMAYVFLDESDDCMLRLVCESGPAGRNAKVVPGKQLIVLTANAASLTRAKRKYAARVGRVRGPSQCTTVFPKCSINVPAFLAASGLL